MIGFTGTREGMNEAEESQCALMLGVLYHQTAENLFCYGTHQKKKLLADERAAHIAKQLGYELVPFDADTGTELERNRQIVSVSMVLLAAPLRDKEEQRSGTWATVRYMRAVGKPVVMLSRGNR